MQDEDVMELIRKRDALKSINEVRIGAQVMDIKIYPAQPKVNKLTKEPILDGEGNPSFWEESAGVTFGVIGGSMWIKLPVIEVQNIRVGDWVLIEGRYLNDTIKPSSITLI